MPRQSGNCTTAASTSSLPTTRARCPLPACVFEQHHAPRTVAAAVAVTRLALDHTYQEEEVSAAAASGASSPSQPAGKRTKATPVAGVMGERSPAAGPVEQSLEVSTRARCPRSATRQSRPHRHGCTSCRVPTGRFDEYVGFNDQRLTLACRRLACSLSEATFAMARSLQRAVSTPDVSLSHRHGPCFDSSRAGFLGLPLPPAWASARSCCHVTDHQERDMSDDQELSAPVASAPTRQICQGPVMPIGGAEDKDPGSDILERFIALAGGEQGSHRHHPHRLRGGRGGRRALRQSLREAGSGGGGLAAG